MAAEAAGAEASTGAGVKAEGSIAGAAGAGVEAGAALA